MKIIYLTIFPELFTSFLETSLIKKSRERGLLTAECLNIRDFSDPPHHHVDDIPYGGGAGMVMRPEPLIRAIRAAKQQLPTARVIALTPAAPLFTQAKASELAASDLIFICGRYEGIDQRVIDIAVDEVLSIGEFVVMGGEVPAMLVTEAALRLVPGVVGNQESVVTESFAATSPSLEAPQYTRPPEFEGQPVPEVLLSGNHRKIAEWRAERGAEMTAKFRPDLLKRNEE